MRFAATGAMVSGMEDTKAESPDFEFEVAGTAELTRYGVVVFGWFRSGSIAPGNAVAVQRLPDRRSRLAGVGMLCGPGPSAGGPNGQLIFSDQDLAREMRVGDRLTRSLSDTDSDVEEVLVIPLAADPASPSSSGSAAPPS